MLFVKNTHRHYTLLTLHSRGHENFPRTHIALKITPSAMSNIDLLNIIPSDGNLVYEIFLLDHTFIDYQRHLSFFVTWAFERNIKLLFTIPARYFNDLVNSLPTLNLTETSRPFQEALCASLIT